MKRIIKLLKAGFNRWIQKIIYKIKFTYYRIIYIDNDLAIIATSNLFHRNWYLKMNDDVKKAKVCPVSHYLTQGWKEGRNPSPIFNGNSYLLMNPDIAQAAVNPLLHYEKYGKSEARIIKDNNSIFEPSKKNTFVPLTKEIPLNNLHVKLIAFYLPQFHEIPENNKWWGKGFTEWTNVKKAKPLFREHYQPHVPGELGYYNLLDINVMKRQIEIARLYGIGGFCFYFYWFGGKKLLEQPLLNYLNDKSLNLPFCLCWANENWTRRWDGLDSEVLISQKHAADDDIEFIKYISKYFKDQRYIRIDGKPLLVVYRPSLLPDSKQTATRWRDWLKNNNLGEIYLAYVQSWNVSDHPHVFGFDAAIEFPPDKSNNYRIYLSNKSLNGNSFHDVFNWVPNMEKIPVLKSPDYKLFRGVCPSWDNTPRRKSSASILVNNTPELFEEWVGNTIVDTINRFTYNIDERLIFVNAWNEWAEGAYLEPDRKYGYAWLQAIRNALSPFSNIIPLNPETDKKFILFDILFCQGGFHGGGEYGKAVFRELVNKVITRTDYVIYVAINRHLSIDESILSLCKNNSSFIKLLYVTNLDDIRKLVNTNLFDVFFTPALVVHAKGYDYLKSAGNDLGFQCTRTRIVGTLHDIRDLEMAEDYLKIFEFRKMLGCNMENNLKKGGLQKNISTYKDYADSLKRMYKKIIEDDTVTNIITVSNYSKNSIVEKLNVNEEKRVKFNVLYSCMKNRVAPVPFNYKGNDFKNIKYLLSINLSRIEKNGSAIVKAMDELFSDYELFKNYYSVLTGIKNLNQFDIQILNKDRFIIFGFLPPENLEYLYSNAECHIYASLNEGFGYPPIEAMSYDVPSVVSEISAIPEICGEAVVYCNPYDVLSIKQAILKCIKDPPSLQILRNRYAYITSRQISDLNKLVEIILN